MQTAFIILLLLAALVGGRVLSRRSARRRARRTVDAQWGVGPEETLDADALLDIARYWREKQSAVPDGRGVDDITWNDLDMDAVFQRINHTQSNVGAEALYAMLRDVGTSDAALKSRGKWIESLGRDEEMRKQAQCALLALGRERFHGAYPYLFKPDYKAPKHAFVYYVLAALPLTLLALGFVWPGLFVGVLLGFAVNAVVYYRTRAVWMGEQCAIRHLASMLHCANRLSTAKLDGLEGWPDEVRTLCERLKPIARWNALYAMQRVSEMDFFTDYLRIFFQLDMISLTRLALFLSKHVAEVARLYALVGELDACCAVASVRVATPHCATPEFSEGRAVEAVRVSHPLVKEPVPNDLFWQRNMLITGSNASGKSTFIKAIALNAILAQSILTCWAEKFTMPRVQVMSSMALRDSVEGGESYFIVEVRSLRRILSALREDVPTLIFIDEILRGTNTVERIATSAALLNYLSGQDALCMAATHDIELTRLTDGYEQGHFREEITPDGMGFTYKLMAGPCTTRNAIKLLEVMTFPKAVTQQAGAMAAGFDETGKWTSLAR